MQYLSKNNQLYMLMMHSGQVILDVSESPSVSQLLNYQQTITQGEPTTYTVH